MKLSRSALSKRVRSGSLRRVHRGVYYSGLGAMTFEQRCAAAVLAVGSGSALTGLSAARLLDVWGRTAPREVQVRCGRRGIHVAGVDVRYSSIWNIDRDIMVHKGLPMVRCERMVIDLAVELTRYQLTNIVKESAFRGWFRVDRFQETSGRLAGIRGMSLARRAVASYLAGCAGSRSDLEDRMLRLIASVRLPMPDDMGAPIGPHEVDLLWRRRRLVIEVDGPGHRQPNSRRRDPVRDEDLTERGFTVVRFTKQQIDHEPMFVVRALDRLFA